MKITLGRIEQGICPYCGSWDIDYDPMSSDDGESIYYKAKCRSCHRKFEEWYGLQFIGHNVGDDYEIITEPGDGGMEIEVSDNE